jgi:hypothetical protein
MNGQFDEAWEVFLKTYRIVFHVDCPYDELYPNVLIDLFAEMETLNMQVEYVLMCSHTFAAIRKWGRDVFDTESDREKFKTGVMGKTWGASILVNNKVPEGLVFISSGQTAGTLQLGVVTPGIKDIIEIHQMIKDASSGLQSKMRKLDDLVRSLVFKVQKLSQ